MSLSRLLMVAAGGGSFSGTPPAPSTGLDDWQDALANVGAGVKWTALGTSITAGTGASDSAHRWVNIVQASLVSAYGSHFTLTNAGHSNSYVADFLSGGGYRSDVTGLPSDTALVIIETGVNDCYAGTSAATFQGRLETLIDDVATYAPNASILVLGMYEIDSLDAADWDPYLAAMADAADTKGVAFYSVAPTFFGGTAGTFTAPGSSVVKQGFTVNAFSSAFDLATGDGVRAMVTSALTSAGLGVIAGTGTYNESSGNGLGKHIFGAAGSAQTGCVLYAFPYSAGYTGGGTFTYGPVRLADGVHPNDAGHAELASQVFAFLT